MKERPDIVAKLKEQLNDWRGKVVAKYARPNEIFEKEKERKKDR